jgi:hypothetical protein
MSVVPPFLRQDQLFIPCPELKAELGRLEKHYAALPEEVRNKGSARYAAYPPREGHFLTSQLYDRFLPGWRNTPTEPKERTKEENDSIMARLRPLLDQIEREGTLRKRS